MRVLRTSWIVAAALGIAPGLASAQYTPQGLLTKNAPVFRGVDHDLPAALVKGDDPAVKAAVDACKVEVNKKGFTVRDGQGKLLRRFIDTNGLETQRPGEKEPIAHLDQWSYYQDGFEVYREVDTNEDGSLDEVRWMNSAGSISNAARIPLNGSNTAEIARSMRSPSNSRVLDKVSARDLTSRVNSSRVGALLRRTSRSGPMSIRSRNPS